MSHIISAWLAVCCIVASSYAVALSGRPADLKCPDEPLVQGAYNYLLCTYEGRLYKPKGHPDAAFKPHVMLTWPVVGNNLQITLDLQGDPSLTCTWPSGGYHPKGFLLRFCEAYEPSKNLFPGMDPWYGPLNGTDPIAWRAATAIAYVENRYADTVNAELGYIAQGRSKGATAAVNFTSAHSLFLYSRNIVLSHGEVPALNFVDPERGWYWKSDAVQNAWAPFDPMHASFHRSAKAGRQKDNYYSVHGGQNDQYGFDAIFFRRCEEYKVACYGTWDQGGHSEGEAGVDMPRGRFATPLSSVGLTTPLPVFTNSTANDWSLLRGHYNLGLGWAFIPGYFVDTPEKLLIPIQYVPRKDIGMGVADQPDEVTFSVTLRRYKLEGETFTWRFGDQSGEVARGGTIDGLSMQKGFKGLELTPKRKFRIVYTRQPRATDPVPGSILEDAANFQHATDVGRINFSLAESDVVVDDLHGTVKVIHNCTESPVHCVAHEGRVSPDGTKIAYSVGFGDTLFEARSQGIPLGIYDIRSLVTSEIWIHDLITGESRSVSSGHQDRGPEWQNNHTLVFTSDRASVYPNWAYNGNAYPLKSLQVYRARLTDMGLVDFENLTPHEMMAMNPLVSTGGDILYSSWQGDGDRGKTHTPVNRWWIMRMDGNGANTSAELGGHGSPPIQTTIYLSDWIDTAFRGEGVTQFKALRPVSEIFRGVFAANNYYRLNMNGRGMPLAWDDEPGEGALTALAIPEVASIDSRPGSGRYVPSSIRSLTPYGTDTDAGWPRKHKDGMAAGRAGFASALPGDNFMYTHNRGYGYDQIFHDRANRAAMGGEPTSKSEIRMALVPVVRNPFDESQSIVIACKEDEWQCYDSDAIETYQALYGQAEPVQPETLPPGDCFLEVKNARNAELYAIPGSRTPEQDHISFQAGHPDYAARVRKLRIQTVELHDSLPRGPGYKSISETIDVPIPANGFIKQEVPCGTPLLMAGVDGQGEAFVKDQMLHSLRPGETRTCCGCHDGHSEERIAELRQAAVC